MSATKFTCIIKTKKTISTVITPKKNLDRECRSGCKEWSAVYTKTFMNAFLLECCKVCVNETDGLASLFGRMNYNTTVRYFQNGLTFVFF